MPKPIRVPAAGAERTSPPLQTLSFNRARMALDDYRRKRDFSKTPEPEGGKKAAPAGRLYAIQKHAASRLHYDLRLELDGYLKSWAIPKGPSFDPKQKRLAVHVEDHPVAYASFEGVIPEAEYGGGTVMLWDQGQWIPEGDPAEEYRRGRLHFEIVGEKLRGRWALARMGGNRNEDGKNWLLIKRRDEYTREEQNGSAAPDEDRSVLTGRTMAEIRSAKDAVWQNGKSVRPAQPEPDTQKKAPDPGTGKPADDPSHYTNARKGNPPSRIRPQLATLVDTPPEGDRWVHEFKYDGYRLLARITADGVRLFTRNGNDWTDRFPRICEDFEKFPGTPAVIDGEVVVQLADGTTDFQALQNALQGIPSGRLLFYLFDMPWCGGYDLTAVPLIERKRLLKQMVDRMPSGTETLRYSDHLRGQGEKVLGHACRYALEGIVSKRTDSPYEQKRSRHWVKTKCGHRQEFVIGGYTKASGTRTGFGALLLGYYDRDGNLRYCGKVGTGFNERMLTGLTEEMEKRRRKTPPFADPPRGREARDVEWITPELVAEVEFSGWTREAILRHPSFKGLREDKSAREVGRETDPPERQPEKASESSASVLEHVRLTHPDRVLYPEQGVTKRDLAQYYDRIAGHILPHLIDRPLSLVRCPKGRSGECFYQKHFDETLPDPLSGFDIREKKTTATYIILKDACGLVSLAQMGVLEIHPWNARIDRIERPDRMVMDLDPGPGISWEQIVEAAFLFRDFFREIGLESFVKTTGGKGVHIVIPLVRRSGWDELKAFARGIAEIMVQRFPDRFTATMSKEKRKAKIFVDYLRNSRGATSVAAYSPRALNGAPVSAPLRWDELTTGMASNAYRIDNLPNRINALKRDPWEQFFEMQQSITKSMRKTAGLE